MSNSPQEGAERRISLAQAQGIGSEDDRLEDLDIYEALIDPNSAEGQGKGAGAGSPMMMPPMMGGRGGGAGGAGGGASGGTVSGVPSTGVGTTSPAGLGGGPGGLSGGGLGGGGLGGGGLGGGGLGGGGLGGGGLGGGGGLPKFAGGSSGTSAAGLGGVDRTKDSDGDGIPDYLDRDGNGSSRPPHFVPSPGDDGGILPPPKSGPVRPPFNSIIDNPGQNRDRDRDRDGDGIPDYLDQYPDDPKNGAEDPGKNPDGDPGLPGPPGVKDPGVKDPGVKDPGLPGIDPGGPGGPSLPSPGGPGGPSGPGGGPSGPGGQDGSFEVDADSLRSEAKIWESAHEAYLKASQAFPTTAQTEWGLASTIGKPTYDRIHTNLGKWLSQSATEFKKIADNLKKAADSYDAVEGENTSASSGTND